MKRAVSIILFAVLLISSSYTVNALSSLYSFGDWLLSVREDVDTLEYSVHAYKGDDSSIAIPSLYGGYFISSIDSYAFAGNDSLVSVNLNGHITEIKDGTFVSASLLETVNLTASVKKLGEGAFASTPSLNNVNLNVTGITEVPASCFADSGLTQVSLPSTCESIGSYAFARCGDLEKIVIPASVTEIDDTAFEGCDDLVIYAVPVSYAAEYAEEHNIPRAVECLLGDCDGDGKVTILDATRLQRLLAELEVDNDGMMAVRGDCNGDGLDILDATKIQRWLAALPVAEPISSVVTSTY